MEKISKKNPKTDPELVKTRNQEINNFLKLKEIEIKSKRLKVFILDECHLLWGDVEGYVWGKRGERVEMNVVNEREKQTFFGALDYQTKKFFLKDYPTADSCNTINFLKELRKKCRGKKMIIIWDGASYHRSKEIQNYLQIINKDLTPENWKITCVLFAPYAPKENPVETIWLQLKNCLRKYYHLLPNFSTVKKFFELVAKYHLFDIPNIENYSAFSQII